MTVERAFVLADGQGALREWGYVALTRSRKQTRLYTIANQLEPDAPPHRPEPAGPVDRLAEALARPAAESLAADAATTRGNSHDPGDRARLGRQARLLVDRRRALEKERTQAARELHGATRELAGMGPIGRARNGRRLTAHIDEGRDALARLDAELKRLDHEHQALGTRLREISRVKRPRPGRELTRDRGLDRGIELGL